MKTAPARLLRLFMAAWLLAVSTVQPAMAQDDDAADISALRDTETELLFKDVTKPLIQAAGLDPHSVNIVLLNDPEINAFVATGQTVYVQSGLLLAADNVNQLQGVIAHELGHVAGGHSISFGKGEGAATKISIATLILGALAIAAGAGEAGMGIMAAGQQVAMGNLLSFSRAQEATADQAGASYLSKAGISGKGMLDFFAKLQNQEYRLGNYEKDSYASTHPLSSERIQALEQLFSKDPAWGKPVDSALNARFLRVKAKLLGFVDPRHAVQKYPESDQSVPAHYARAYAYHVSGYPDKALAETLMLLKTSPDDPFFLELEGQVLLESGKPAQALAPLREATSKSGNAPLIASMLGHALVATEDPKNYPEAKRVLKDALVRDNQDSDAWYQLGVIYASEGDEGRAQLASAEQSSLESKPKLALAHAEMAMRSIPSGTPDWLRAQDIAMVAKDQIKDKKK